MSTENDKRQLQWTEERCTDDVKMKDGIVPPDTDNHVEMPNESKTTDESSNVDLSADEQFDDTRPPEERMTFALSCKDAGNELLKTEDLAAARDKYTEGLKHLRGMNESTFGTVELLKALYTNLSLVHMKTAAWRNCIEAATKALGVDACNEKALYRRAFAYLQLDESAASKVDFVALCKLNPSSTEGRRGLAAANKRIAEEKAASKLAYSSIFTRASSALYADRVEERKMQQEADEKRLNVEKSIWEEEMSKRKEAGETELSFEEWKAKKESIDPHDTTPRPTESTATTSTHSTATQPTTTQSTATQPTDIGSAKPKKPKTSKQSQRHVSEDEFDDEDLKIMAETKRKGYCYFKRDLTEEEKKLRERNAPARIVEHDTSSLESGAPPRPSQTSSSPSDTGVSRSISSWNAVGTTWEEKDMTSWAKDALTSRLGKVHVKQNPFDTSNSNNCLDKLKDLIEMMKPDGGSDGVKNLDNMTKLGAALIPMEGKITKVTSVDGDASVAVVRGTKRYLFDFEVKLKWKIDIDESFGGYGASSDEKKKMSYSGDVYFSDVSSAKLSGVHWSESGIVTYSGKVEGQHEAATKEMLKKLRETCAAEVSLFEEDFRKQVP